MEAVSVPAATASDAISVSDAAWAPPATGDKGPLSVRDAARSLSDARYKRDAELNTQAEAPPAAEPAPELPEQGNADPLEAPGETAEAEPAELPTIDPPRSWTKGEKERFATLPRETQEYIADREQERERAIRQSQNEAAEKTKAVTAKEQQLEQIRQQAQSRGVTAEIQSANPKDNRIEGRLQLKMQQGA